MATQTTETNVTDVEIPKRWRHLLLFLYLLLVYLVILLPVAYVFPFGLTGDFSGVTRQEFMGPLFNSFQLAIFVGIMTMILSTIAARYYRETKYQNAYLLVMSLPLFIPGSTHALAVAVTVKTFGISLSFWTLAASHIMYTFPFGFLMILAIMAGLPENLIAASKDLGAGEFRAFFDIELPLIQDGVISAFLVGVLLSLNEAERASILGGGFTTISGVQLSYFEAVGLDPTLYTLNLVLVVTSVILISVILILLFFR